MKYKQFLLPAILIVMMGCASKNIMRTWSSKEQYDTPFKKFLVMGLVNNVSLRSDVENHVVIEARKAGINAVNGMSMFPPELGKPFDDIEQVKVRLKEKNFEGILTISLIDMNAPRYIKPETRFEPLEYYDRFSNYYFRTYALVYHPGYFSEQSRYFIETNFYELKVGTLVWSGRSVVFDAEELDIFLKKYTKGLFKEFKAAGILAP